MALKKKTTKKKTVAKRKSQNFEKAYEFLVRNLGWRGKCKDLIEESKKLL